MNEKAQNAQKEKSFSQKSSSHEGQKANYFSGWVRFQQPSPECDEIKTALDSFCDASNNNYQLIYERAITGPKQKQIKVHIRSAKQKDVGAVERDLRFSLPSAAAIKVALADDAASGSKALAAVQRMIRDNIRGELIWGTEKIAVDLEQSDLAQLSSSKVFLRGLNAWMDVCEQAKHLGEVPSLALIAPQGLDVEPYLRVLAGILWQEGFSAISGYLHVYPLPSMAPRCNSPAPLISDLRDKRLSSSLGRGRASGEVTDPMLVVKRPSLRPAEIRDDSEESPQLVVRSYYTGREQFVFRRMIPIPILTQSQLENFYVISGNQTRFPFAISTGLIESMEKADYVELCKLSGMKGKHLKQARASYDLAKKAEKEFKQEHNTTLGEENKNIVAGKKALEGEVQLEDEVFAELDSLIGLEGVKQHVREIATLIHRRGRRNLPCVHMLFTGNPGTAKTTVARILSDILYEIGVCKKKGKFIETDSTGLVAEWVGQTAPKTKKKIDEALGGVLFIDEAYSIAPNERTDRSFGPEAIAVLVKELEDKRDDFCCIMAGYPDEMENFIQVNPGLRDRIAFHLHFPDYSPDECVHIYEKFAEDEGYEPTKEALDCLRRYVDSALHLQEHSFSNGRLVRKIFERSKFKQALRTADNSIVLADVQLALASEDLRLADHKQTFGFALRKLETAC